MNLNILYNEYQTMNINKQIAISCKNKNYDELYRILDEEDVKKESMFNRALYVIQNYNTKMALNIINKHDDRKDYSFISLKAKILVSNYRVEQYHLLLNKLSDKMRKKRIYMEIVNYYLDKDIKESFDYILDISDMFRLFYIDFSPYLKSDKINKDNLFSIMSDHEIIMLDPKYGIKTVIEDDCCVLCDNKLRKFSLSQKKINKLLSNIKKTHFISDKNKQSLATFNNFIKNRDIDVFIDGNNVIYSYKGKVTNIGFNRLMKIYNILSTNNKSFVITLHIKYKTSFNKYIKSKKFRLNMKNIYYTPYNHNDDWFFLYGALKSNAMIITNDKFRDHIFKLSSEDLISNDLSRWMDNNIITYVANHDVKLVYPSNISYKIQKNSSKWHLPIGNDEWNCY